MSNKLSDPDLISNDVGKQSDTISVKEKCIECIRGPANLLKSVVFIACFICVVVQISNCIYKVIKPPITTYTHFDYNDTILYPAVTFCRDPPYKSEEMKSYNLYSHPRYTSTWAFFPFDNKTIQEAWNDITYKENDVFIQHGFNCSPRHVELTKKLTFVNGMCFTLTPKQMVTSPSKKVGYSILLKHSEEDIASSISINPPGYHMFIHSVVDPFTELIINENSMMEYLFINVGEEIDIKLSTSQYNKLSKEQDWCNKNETYSAASCAENELWTDLVNDVGCSGPWMDIDVPHCTNYSTMSNLIVKYLQQSEVVGASYKNCRRRCDSVFYNAYVVNRQGLSTWDYETHSWIVKSGTSAALQTQVYIYFNSMVITVYEEHYNYDWSVFLADLGGTVGFLLGLSVIGIIKLLGKTFTFLNPVIKSKTRKTVDFQREKYKEPATYYAHNYYLEKNPELFI